MLAGARSTWSLSLNACTFHTSAEDYDGNSAFAYRHGDCSGSNYSNPEINRISRLLNPCSFLLSIFVHDCRVCRRFVSIWRVSIFIGRCNKDRRVDLYLLPSARDLIIDKQGNGFRARYKITKEQVVQFLDAQWSEYGPYSVSKREESVDDSEGTRAMHDLWFGNLSWPYLKDATVYRGPTSARGTGFELWYSERNQIAYQRMGYW